MKRGNVKPRFFATPAAFRQWLQKNHDSVSELWVGFRKRATGMASITWPQSVDQALCFGWIDGIRKSIDDESYMIRFTPRRRGSVWSAVNTKRAHELMELGLMQPAGARAFAERDEEKTRQYSFERQNVELSEAQLEQFRANRKAWQFWQAQPPYYRTTIAWWVISAKQEATRERRLTKLIAESEAGQRVGNMTKPPAS